MNMENKKDTVWKPENQKWWQEYSAMGQKAKQQGVNGVPESNYTGFGSNTSGLYIHGSNTSAYGSGLYIHGSNTSAYGSGLYIHGSNTSAYGSGLYVHGSNGEVYGAQAAPVKQAECHVDMSQVFVPDYLREAAQNSANAANNAAGVLAYGLDLI